MTRSTKLSLGLGAILAAALARGCGGEAGPASSPSTSHAGATVLAGQAGATSNAGQAGAGANISAGAGVAGVTTAGQAGSPAAGAAGKAAAGAGGAGATSAGAQAGTSGAGTAGAGGAGDNGGTGGSGGVGGNGGAGGEPWAVVPPADWEPWTGWAQCRIFQPGSKGKLPSILWQPCPNPLPQKGCEVAELSWGGFAWKALLLPGPRAFPSEPTDSLVFQVTFKRIEEPGRKFFSGLARPSGEIVYGHTQEMTTDAHGCNDSGIGSGAGKAAWHMVGVAPDKEVFELEAEYGTIGFTPDGKGLRKLISEWVPQEATSTPSYMGSAQWVVRWPGTGYRWDALDKPVTIYDGSKGPLMNMIFWKDGAFITTGSLWGQIYHWSEAKGITPVRVWPAGELKAAWNFATDGQVMVWSEGTGPYTSDKGFAKYDMMISPYGENVGATLPKRLRGDHSYALYPWVTGCGYAAKPGGNPAGGVPFTIVRLSDGAWWSIPNNTKEGLRWSTAEGITCEHVYGTTDNGLLPDGRARLFRLAIADLGPPNPPD